MRYSKLTWYNICTCMYPAFLSTKSHTKVNITAWSTCTLIAVKDTCMSEIMAENKVYC